MPTLDTSPTPEARPTPDARPALGAGATLDATLASDSGLGLDARPELDTALTGEPGRSRELDTAAVPDTTLSRRIATDLRTAIERGDYQPGHRLPSGRVLMRTYRVARQTVQNAFDLLRGEGMIVTKQGAGSYVRARPSVLRMARNRFQRSTLLAGDDNEPIDATATPAGNPSSQPQPTDTRASPNEPVTARTEPADEHSADALGLQPGEEVLVRERVMHADGAPVQLATSRLPMELATRTGIDRPDTGTGGIYARLAEAGHALDHFVEYVSTRPARPAEATSLELSTGAPVLCITRIAFDRLGTAVELNDMVLSGDRYQLVYEIPAD
jgi:GntR family transcriptional regulator